VCHQQIADVMLYEDHQDPQLRGNFRMLLANFIMAVLNENQLTYNQWIEKHCCDDNPARFEMDALIKIIIKGLEDESSNCCRQTIISLNTCLEKIAESPSNIHILPLLNSLPLMAANPYWLVKVTYNSDPPKL
jgi:huntingtin